MKLGKIEIAAGVTKNHITEQALIRLFEEHIILLERIILQKSFILICICKHFADIGDEIRAIPEYKIVLKKDDIDIALRIVGIINDKEEYVYDLRH